TIRAGTTIHLFCESAGSDPGDARDAGPGGAGAGVGITAGERGGPPSLSAGPPLRPPHTRDRATEPRGPDRPPPPPLACPRGGRGGGAWTPDRGTTGRVRTPMACGPEQ